MKINESQLRQIIQESIKMVLKEGWTSPSKRYAIVGRGKNKKSIMYTPEFDKEGFDQYGIDKDFYNREGFDVKTGYDRDGYNKKGYDRQGYNREGYDAYGLDKDGYNRNGVDKYGLDKAWKTRKSFDQGKCYIYIGKPVRISAIKERLTGIDEEEYDNSDLQDLINKPNLSCWLMYNGCGDYNYAAVLSNGNIYLHNYPNTSVGNIFKDKFYHAETYQKNGESMYRNGVYLTKHRDGTYTLWGRIPFYLTCVTTIGNFVANGNIEKISDKAYLFIGEEQS